MSQDDRERQLRQGGLAYVGCVSSSLSHEFNNCVTIIGEATGLLEDLCQLAGPSHPITPERLQRQCEVIGRQVSRTQQLIRGLNTFAHSFDDPGGAVNLHQEVRAAVLLSERLARIKGFAFDLPPTDPGLRVPGPCSLLHELLFLLFRCIYEGGAKGGTIELRLEDHQQTVRLLVQGDNPHQVDRLQLEYPALLAEELQGQLAIRPADQGGVTMEISWPTKR